MLDSKHAIASPAPSYVLHRKVGAKVPPVIPRFFLTDDHCEVVPPHPLTHPPAATTCRHPPPVRMESNNVPVTLATSNTAAPTGVAPPASYLDRALRRRGEPNPTAAALSAGGEPVHHGSDPMAQTSQSVGAHHLPQERGRPPAPPPYNHHTTSSTMPTPPRGSRRVMAILVDGFSFAMLTHHDAFRLVLLKEFLIRHLSCVGATPPMPQHPAATANSSPMPMPTPGSPSSATNPSTHAAVDEFGTQTVACLDSCLHFFHPDPADFDMKALERQPLPIRDQLLANKARYLYAVQEFGWTVHTTPLKLESGNWKASREDLRLLDVCIHVCREKGVPPIGASPERLTVTDVFLVTSDKDHLVTLQSDNYPPATLLWCVDFARTASLLAWGSQTGRLLTPTFNDLLALETPSVRRSVGGKTVPFQPVPYYVDGGGVTGVLTWQNGACHVKPMTTLAAASPPPDGRLGAAPGPPPSSSAVARSTNGEDATPPAATTQQPQQEEAVGGVLVGEQIGGRSSGSAVVRVTPPPPKGAAVHPHPPPVQRGGLPTAGSFSQVLASTHDAQLGGQEIIVVPGSRCSEEGRTQPAEPGANGVSSPATTATIPLEPQQPAAVASPAPIVDATKKPPAPTTTTEGVRPPVSSSQPAAPQPPPTGHQVGHGVGRGGCL